MNLFKYIILSLLFKCFALSSLAQEKQIDSLQQIIITAKHDTVKVNCYIKISKLIQNKKTDQALTYLEMAKVICEKQISNLNSSEKQLKNIYIKKNGDIHYRLAEIYRYQKQNRNRSQVLYKKALKAYFEVDNYQSIKDAYSDIVWTYDELDQAETAIIWAKKSLKVAQQIKDKDFVSSALFNLGYLYATIGDFKSALSNYEKCIMIFEELNNERRITAVINNLGYIYMTQKLYPEAKTNFEKGYHISQKLKDTMLMAINLNNLGTIELNQKNYSNALKYYLKCIDIYGKKNKKDMYYSNFLRDIGVVYTDMNELKLAGKYLKESLKIADSIGDKSTTYTAYIGLCYYFLKCKNYSEALIYGKKSLAIAQETGYPSDISYATEQLAQIYSKLKDYKKALEMAELATQINDSLNNSQNLQASYKSKLKYEFEKRSMADSMNVADEKKISEARVAENTAKIKEENTQRLVLIGGLILMLGFSILIYNRFKKSHQQKLIIEEQKKIVDESQKKIIDSINYAKKIQNSILPTGEEISKLFPEHFIFFKPKDIVSGDFYWFHHENNLSFFAVADCTGHGVPGAFMTMIAHSSLIEVVIEQKITAPDKILSALHQQIFKNLQQQKGDENSQDGMDISLAVIDHKNNILHFSGARNHGFLVDGTEIRTLKATPKSIGGLSILGEIEPERNFKSETFQIHPDSLLILTTDGILDQLNKNDEKFGNERFKELIVKMYLKGSGSNLESVENSYMSWTQGSVQLDDVLLMAINLN